jgi:hypothetical protein
VRQALSAAGRSDLIGSGCDALIPAQPPRAALQARMAKARRDVAEGRYVHTIPQPSSPAQPAKAPASQPQALSPKSAGYRPHRKSSKRRPQ